MIRKKACLSIPPGYDFLRRCGLRKEKGFRSKAKRRDPGSYTTAVPLGKVFNFSEPPSVDLENRNNAV